VFEVAHAEACAHEAGEHAVPSPRCGRCQDQVNTGPLTPGGTS
jgi:hypothetical protein